MATISADLLAFMRTQRLAVQASASRVNGAQAAVVGVGVTDAFELVFDTLESTRKMSNLRTDPRVAFVLGGWQRGDERTVQYQGVADEPRGHDLARVKSVYFAAWPDGPQRENWPGLVYVRVRPTWIRFSDFNRNPPVIVELTAHDLPIERA